MGVSLDIIAHARAVWAVDAPHIDVVHARRICTSRMGMPTSSTTSPSDPLIIFQVKG
jgi:hypothetical protein